MIPLKDATAIKHKEAETMPYNTRMFNGQLSEKEYLQYLLQQKEIFKTIESKGIPHPDLARSCAIEEDIYELTSKGHQLDQILPKTKEYLNHLSSLSQDEVLPHVYLNYLALMFGGQMMKKKVPSSGKMYEFDNQKEAMKAIRNVQKDEWADEVNQAYDYIINIFDDLENSIVGKGVA